MNTIGAVSLPRQSAAQTAQPVNQLRVTRSEWIKFSTLRSNWISLLIIVASTIGIGALISFFLNQQWDSLSAADRATFDPIGISLSGVSLAQLVVAVLGVLIVTGEYSNGMIRTSLAATPKRLSFLFGKLTISAAVSFVVSLGAALAAFLIGQQLLGSHGVSLDAPHAPRAIVGSAFYLMSVSVISSAFGFITRSTAAGIAAVVALLLVLPVMGALIPYDWMSDALNYLPAALGQRFRQRRGTPPCQSEWPSSPWSSGWSALSGSLRRCFSGGTSSRKESIPLDSRNQLPAFVKLPSQWPKWPWLGDVLLFLVLESLIVAGVFVAEEPAWTLLAYQVITLPLFFRRRYPYQVLAVVWIGSLAFVLFDGSVDGLLQLMIAVYSVAVSRNRNGALLAAAAAEVFVIANVIANVLRADSISDMIAAFVFQSGLMLAALFLGTTVRARRLYLQSLEERAARLERERDQQAELAAARERTRIAREMHDIVAHSLSVMITLADGAVATVKRDPDVAGEAMEQVAYTGRQALGEMRNLLGVLRSDEVASFAPQPGLNRIETLLDEVRMAGLPVSVTIIGEPRAMSSTQETTVYRFVQEGLTNVLKHARSPSRAWVTLEWETDGMHLEVRDDGMASGEAETQHGLGLRGKQERLAIFGGAMSAGPLQPTGWATRGTIPFAQESV